MGKQIGKSWEWHEDRFRGGKSGLYDSDGNPVCVPNCANDGDTGAAWFDDMLSDEDASLIAAAPDLLRELKESTTDLVVTIGNIGAEIRRSSDPNASGRWEGVVEHLQKQVAANRAAIAKATQCLECGGVGSVDSGGFTPWGEGINVPCTACQSDTSEPPKYDPERVAAENFCRQNDLPLTGFVCLHNGVPFQWQNNRPRPQSVVPGVVALVLDGGGRFVAVGGNIDGGANKWEQREQ